MSYPAPVRELRRLLNSYLEPEHVATALRAFEVGDEAHRGQTRRSGEDYILHPVAVAGILASMRMDHQTITAAILHDTVEDTPLTLEHISSEFGEPVARLVDGVTKLDKMKFRTRQEADAESFRKLLLAMSRDLRVIFIKLADRLHNMRTIGAMANDARRRISNETLQIYAPIADRLGMHALKDELEELGFANLHPNRYRVIQRAARTQTRDRKLIIDAVTGALKKRLNEAGIPCRVEGREKSIYGVYQKMRDKSLPFRRVHDLYGFRVITHSEAHCYQALGVAHALYKPRPGSFKDYIALPKPNGYQSLHTVLTSPYNVPIEIQIRTEEMDMVAEKGAAAHWLYKATPPDVGTATRARDWLLKLVESQSRTQESTEFLDTAKAELFPDEVFVFTPKGKIIDLKADATVLDFAYAIHTDVGNRARGALIDYKPAPLSARLENGQTVQIDTDKNAAPRPEWLQYVVTAKARTAIRSHLKNLEQADSVAIGHRLLDQALARRDSSLERVPPRRLDRYVRKVGLTRLEDLLIRIARGELLASSVAQKLMPLTRRRSGETRPGEIFTVGGAEGGGTIRYGTCCHPIPGDRIVGHFHPGRGLIVHRDNCPKLPALRAEHPERILPVTWEQVPRGTWSAMIKVVSINGPGVLAAVSSSIGQAGANIERVEQTLSIGDTAELLFLIGLRDRVHLARVLRRLRRNPKVFRVSREFGRD
ncbi:MAG: bifunctional (p)ppGpp synthetase/guanosine-3',5'-bis(diphosphate) 3'-pyrophosphohydrolase [Wenzhouxiangellaceae bacterium]|nr:bifunctional (p)ppGpp synthetase/guanosine-3',5'-bis(diphosphate) 3'-pyrophosphohydrolase [Wenzhouxiangellaceae bacterium]